MVHLLSSLVSSNFQYVLLPQCQTELTSLGGSSSYTAPMHTLVAVIFQVDTFQKCLKITSPVHTSQKFNNYLHVGTNVNISLLHRCLKWWKSISNYTHVKSDYLHQCTYVGTVGNPLLSTHTLEMSNSFRSCTRIGNVEIHLSSTHMSLSTHPPQ